MIAGSPGALVAAGWDLRLAGQDLDDVADAVNSSVRSLETAWTGTASDDARTAITAVGQDVRLAARVCASAETVVARYADVLRAAQEQYETGQDVAEAGAAARLAALDPVTAADADAQVAAGQAQMVAAVGRAERANAEAAEEVRALAGELEQLPAPEAVWAPNDPAQNARDVIAGVGEVAWQSSFGVQEWLYENDPLLRNEGAAQAVRDDHDRLEAAFGADTTSERYLRAQDGTEVAMLFSWKGLVSGARHADDAGELLDDLARGGRTVDDEIDDAWSARTYERPPGESWADPETLGEHFDNHAADFGSRNPQHYVEQAEEFRDQAVSGDLQGLQVKVDGGVVRLYEPSTNTFASFNQSDGAVRTFFKPSNPDYWMRQPG